VSLHDLVVGALDPRLLALVKAAVMEGRPLALEAKAGGTYIGSYDK
jgi:hypothetical protein